MAEYSVTLHRQAITRQAANNAALVAIEPSKGEILAMVGSVDYNDASIDGQVNNAVTAHQPGSSIKPLVYLTAFLKGFSPSTVVQDTPLTLPGADGRPWRPQNHDNRFRGAVTLRNALGNSLNIPAVKVLQFAGLDDTISLAKRFGMTSLGDPATYGLSFTLGGGEVRLIELATAYTVLANGGVQVPVSPILKVVNSDGRVIFEHQSVGNQVVDPRPVYMVNSILSDNNARTGTFGARSPLRLANDRPAAAKTGTTDSYRDTWAMGYTPSLVAGVWVGRNDNAPTRFISGSNAAPLIWNTFMERALADWPHEPFEGPPGLVQDTVCAHNGLPGSGCARVTDWFLEERAPSTLAKLSARAVAVDRVTGRLADQDTPYTDVDFRRYRLVPSGDGPFPPTEYSERGGVGRPWEVLPPTLLPTVLPPTSGPSPTATLPPADPLRWGGGVAPTATPGVPGVRITSPHSDEVLAGRVPVLGSAAITQFTSYRLEYQRWIGGEWTTIREVTSLQPIQDGQLDEWDTAGLENGWYALQLTVRSSSGEEAQARTALTVSNPSR
jgi:membrane peptidoglycan carboxypeptidase